MNAALQNPWLTYSAASPFSAADEEAAALTQPPSVAAYQSPMDKGRIEEAPAVNKGLVPAGATDLLGANISDVSEIFHHARQLVGPTRFVLDEQAFMDAIDPPPLFLQAAQ